MEPRHVAGKTVNVTFLDDMQSPMTLESALRRVQCRVCGKTCRLSFEQMAAVLENDREHTYSCQACKEKTCSLEKKQSS
jgi:uncharacterized protein YlaI